jgi:hypothetical protein
LNQDKSTRKVKKFWDASSPTMSVIQANAVTCRKIDLMWEYALLHNLRRKESGEYISRKISSMFGLVKSGSNKVNEGLSMGLQILSKYKEQASSKVKTVLTEVMLSIKDDPTIKLTPFFKVLNLILGQLDNFDYDAVLRDKAINIKGKINEYVDWVNQTPLLPQLIKTKIIDCLYTIHRSLEYLEDSSNKAIEASQLVSSYTTSALKVTGALSMVGPTFDMLKAGYSLILDFLEPSDFKEQLEILKKLSIGRINSMIGENSCHNLIVRMNDIIKTMNDEKLQDLANTCWPRTSLSEYQKTGQNMLGMIIKELLII